MSGWLRAAVLTAVLIPCRCSYNFTAVDTRLWSYLCPRVGQYIPGQTVLERYDVDSPAACATKCTSWIVQNSFGQCNSFHYKTDTNVSNCELMNAVVNVDVASTQQKALAVLAGFDFYQRSDKDCACVTEPATCAGAAFCGDSYCFDSTCATGSACVKLREQATPSAAFVALPLAFKLIVRDSSDYLHGMCKEVKNSNGEVVTNATRTVDSVASLAVCMSLCTGTVGTPTAPGTAACTGIQYSTIQNGSCTLYDLGTEVPAETTDTTAGYYCYKRLYPPAPAPPCVDSSTACPGWAAKTPSECEVNSAWMSVNCKRSCAICTVPYAGEPPRLLVRQLWHTAIEVNRGRWRHRRYELRVFDRPGGGRHGEGLARASIGHQISVRGLRSLPGQCGTFCWLSTNHVLGCVLLDLVSALACAQH
jgi:hypothetical protein